MIHRAARFTMRLLTRSDGQDLIEYALLTGIIAIAGALLFPTIRDKIGAAYQAWLTGAQDIWEPLPPA
jgi:Flp pilus assembly pilin Flp